MSKPGQEAEWGPSRRGGLPGQRGGQPLTFVEVGDRSGGVLEGDPEGEPRLLAHPVCREGRTHAVYFGVTRSERPC